MAKSAMTKAMEDIAEKLVGASVTELPTVSASDNGKALMVKSGKWQKNDIPSQLPTVSASDNGKVLMVVEGVWAAAELPS